MSLLLHTPCSKSSLAEHYHRAFNRAVDLFIVTAFLTDWDESLKLNSRCRRFRLIIGKDFGITRKAACASVMRWLPANRKCQFMVTDLIMGFHPKAVFWRERDDKCFTIVGSSNLTRAAFETNYEANFVSRISQTEYRAAQTWVRTIEKQAVPVSDDWLSRYKESARAAGGAARTSGRNRTKTTLVPLELPRPAGTAKQIRTRREQLANYMKHRTGLIHLFRRCASGRISSAQLYERLPNYWDDDLGDRLQGPGWERQGKNSDFCALSKSYVTILGTDDGDRDDVVVKEMDVLHQKGVETRKALLTELLCLEFPTEYPVLNKPVQDYLKRVRFRGPRGASEGSRYIDLARRLRFSLLQNPNHPAKTVAELDAVIWLVSKQRH